MAIIAALREERMQRGDKKTHFTSFFSQQLPDRVTNSGTPRRTMKLLGIMWESLVHLHR